MDRTFTTEAELRAFACEFSRTLSRGDVVGLSGPLGAGKTTFVRACVEELHGTDQVTSPTFTFWHRYGAASPHASAPPVDHLDLYRVDDPAALEEMGLEEAFEGDSIVFVEWWQNGGGRLPFPNVNVTIDGAGDDLRTVHVERQ